MSTVSRSISRSISRTSAAVLCAAVLAAQAAPVTIGALSSNDDGSTAVIVDALNHREWLRFDLAAAVGSYGQTLAAIAPGGLYEGFRIAGAADVVLFDDALLLAGTGNSCGSGVVGYVVLCGQTGVVDGAVALLGESFVAGRSLAKFLSDNGGGEEVGFVYAGDHMDGWVQQQNEWAQFAQSDDWGNTIGWLLYRPAGTVDEPGALALAGLAMLAAASAAATASRRRG